MSQARCDELWDTLVTNPDAIQSDKEHIFGWFQNCLTDLGMQTQRDFFNDHLLKVNPCDIDCKFFNCFKEYFRSLNTHDGNLKKASSNNLVVENLELNGLDYIWRVVTDCKTEAIAESAIEYLLNLSYMHVSPKLKKEAVKLHKKFINKCYNNLEEVFLSHDEKQDAVLDGCELEVSYSFIF